MASKTSQESLPSPTYTVRSSGKELRMSYGMYNDIMRLIGNPEEATHLLIRDSGIRDLVIRRLFTENNKAIEKTEELVDSFEIDILPTEVDGIVAWVADHVAYFLLSTGRSMTQVIQKYQEAGQKLSEAFSNLSKNGSED